MVGLAKGLQSWGIWGKHQKVSMDRMHSTAPQRPCLRAPQWSGAAEGGELQVLGGSHHLHDKVSTHPALVSSLLEPRILRGDTGSRTSHDKGALTVAGLRSACESEGWSCTCSHPAGSATQCRLTRKSSWQYIFSPTF